MKRFLLLFPLALQAFCPHQFYIGPDVYWRDYDEKVSPPLKSHEYGLLYGFIIGYEYLKPASFYFGLDANYAYGVTIYDGSLINLATNEVSPYMNRTINDIIDVEARFGYTFAYRCALMSPFVGIGYHYWFRGAAPNNPYGYDEEYSWEYVSAGYRFEYFLSKRWHLGMIAEVMQMSCGQMISSDLSDVTFHLGNETQFALELPITYFPKWRLESSFLRLVPYFRNENIGQSDYHNVVLQGFPETVVEPSSETYIYGLRLEGVYSF